MCHISLIILAVSGGVLLLHVDYDNAQSSHKAKRLDAQKPDKHPEEQVHHWLHNLLSKVQLGKSYLSQALVHLAEECPQAFAVVHFSCRWRCRYFMTSDWRRTVAVGSRPEHRLYGPDPLVAIELKEKTTGC